MLAQVRRPVRVPPGRVAGPPGGRSGRRSGASGAAPFVTVGHGRTAGRGGDAPRSTGDRRPGPVRRAVLTRRSPAPRVQRRVPDRSGHWAVRVRFGAARGVSRGAPPGGIAASLTTSRDRPRLPRSDSLPPPGRDVQDAEATWSQDPVPAAARSARCARSPRPGVNVRSAVSGSRRTTLVPTASSTRRARRGAPRPGSAADCF